MGSFHIFQKGINRAHPRSFLALSFTFEEEQLKANLLSTTEITTMNFNEILLAFAAAIGIIFAVPALAADANGDGIPDDQQQES